MKHGDYDNLLKKNHISINLLLLEYISKVRKT